ncbi:MAG: FKBP-type peptidyl-prolyl cis-trans isomerase [Sphingobacteriaceae bacterium]
MKFIKQFLFLLLAGVLLFSCKKGEVYNPQKQLAVDEELIKTFIATNNIPAQRHESGLYYQIITPGAGSVVYTTATKVTANYTVRLLNGTVIEQSSTPIQFTLGNVITGWQIGVPLIQKGGSIRLLVPSPYAYQNSTLGAIPANSVLDFDITLTDVQN